MLSEQQRLVEDNVRLVYHIFKALGKTEFVIRNKEDICSEGMIGLIKAAKNFDANKGYKFATLASRCIWNQMLMFIRRSKNWQGEVSLYEPIYTDTEGNEITLIDIIDDGGAGAAACEAKSLEAEFAAFKETLKPYPRQILELRAAGYKQRQIADDMNLSQSYVSRVLGKLKRQYKKQLAN